MRCCEVARRVLMSCACKLPSMNVDKALKTQLKISGIIIDTSNMPACCCGAAFAVEESNCMQRGHRLDFKRQVWDSEEM
jgi:hypothetical protein